MTASPLASLSYERMELGRLLRGKRAASTRLMTVPVLYLDLGFQRVCSRSTRAEQALALTC